MYGQETRYTKKLHAELTDVICRDDDFITATTQKYGDATKLRGLAENVAEDYLWNDYRYLDKHYLDIASYTTKQNGKTVIIDMDTIWEMFHSLLNE